jgi:hypothetical protein
MTSVPVSSVPYVATLIQNVGTSLFAGQDRERYGDGGRISKISTRYRTTDVLAESNVDGRQLSQRLKDYFHVFT